MTVIGLLQLELHIPNAQSLKHKRGVIKSLKDRLRNHYNVSVAGIDYLDKWQRSTLAITMVGTDHQYLESRFESISSYVEQEVLGKAFIASRELVFL